MKKLFKKNGKKGFTLAEVLIVIAIIAILLGIAIPVFSTQTEKAREAVDASTIRNAYAEIMTEAVAGDTPKNRYVELTQTKENWSDTALKNGLAEVMTVSTEPGSTDKYAKLEYSTSTQKITLTYAATAPTGDTWAAYN